MWLAALCVRPFMQVYLYYLSLFDIEGLNHTHPPQAQRVTGRAAPGGLGLDPAARAAPMLSLRSGNVSVPRTWHAPRDHAVRARCVRADKHPQLGGVQPYAGNRANRPMTAYNKMQPPQSVSAAAREAKAKRQAVLERVRKQRAQAQKRTVAEWVQKGVIIRASDLKRRYYGAK